MDSRQSLPNLCLVVADRVKEAGLVSPAFILASGAPWSFLNLPYGAVLRTQKGSTLAVSPVPDQADATYVWRIAVKAWGEKKIALDVVDDVPGSDDTFRELIVRLPSAVLLMQKDAFPRFKAACEALGIQLVVHEYHGLLST